jgi:hypothetical protein
LIGGFEKLCPPSLSKPSQYEMIQNTRNIFLARQEQTLNIVGDSRYDCEGMQTELENLTTISEQVRYDLLAASTNYLKMRRLIRSRHAEKADAVLANLAFVLIIVHFPVCLGNAEKSLESLVFERDRLP